ncbi:hypothetical protein NEIFLAOT_01937 [Neisseria flavescens NRL30031/H210]|uniref:Uncharacterized protein n=1 Tax=Neisseria flavescens NRL30031/H210 TaxID=546264 RepID=C0EPP7_NEIFL|nr:hypothetical protein NEIFLAOT_01937 [Neisseria flavescens NRL30031/H210]
MYTVSIRQLIFRRCKTMAERLKIGIKDFRPSETCHIKFQTAFTVMAD